MKKIILILPLISAILWGSVGVFVRKLYSFGFDNFTVLSSRIAIATLILFLGIMIFDKSLLKIKLKDAWVFLAAGLLGMLGLNLAYNESISRLTLSLAAVLLSLAPIFVVLWGAILFKERITVRKVGCMFMAIFGCLLTSGILESTASVKWSFVGIFIGFLSAFFYALYTVFSRLAMDRGYQVFTITFYSMLTITIVLLPLTDFHILGDFLTSEPIENSIFMLLHSAFTSVLPYVLYTVALTQVETGIASILASGGEPIAAMLFGLAFFSEIPTLLSFTGLLVVVAALALILKQPKQKKV